MTGETYNQTVAIQRAQVDIARLEVQMQTLQATVVELKAMNAAQSVQLDSIRILLSEAKGGWRTMVWIGGAAGSLGAGLSWLIEHWKA